MIDDESSEVRPLKTAFHLLAAEHAGQLREAVLAGRMTKQQAADRLIEIMSSPDKMAAVIEASAEFRVAH